MPNGCLNPNATNYNSTATVDDYSCLYLIRDTSNNCQLFKDVLPDNMEDQSFTMSFSMLGTSWVFFHDYQPDMYIHTHQYLYNLKSQAIYKNNAGPPGLYYGTSPNSFFIDIIFLTEVRRRLGMVGSDYFRESGDMILEAVEWCTEVLNSDTDQPDQTLTHLSIWNSKQHSGRIALAQVFKDLSYPNMRRTQGNWSMNNFRDLLQANGTSFLLDIYNNYALDPTALPPYPLPWYLKKMIQDQWFAVRFEFDNTSGDTILLHDTIIQAIKANR